MRTGVATQDGVAAAGKGRLGRDKGAIGRSRNFWRGNRAGRRFRVRGFLPAAIAFAPCGVGRKGDGRTGGAGACGALVGHAHKVRGIRRQMDAIGL